MKGEEKLTVICIKLVIQRNGGGNRGDESTERGSIQDKK